MKKVIKKAGNAIREHLLEFFLVGIVFGMAEDILAIMLHSGQFTVTWRMFFIAAAVAIPLAIISELIVDRTEIFRMKKK